MDAVDADDPLDHRHDDDDQRDLQRGRGGNHELAPLKLQIAEDLDRQRRESRTGEEQRGIELAERGEFLLEASRFAIPLIPGVTPVQGAALREFMVAVLLIVMLRYRPTGLVPEKLVRLPVPPPAHA